MTTTCTTTTSEQHQNASPTKTMEKIGVAASKPKSSSSSKTENRPAATSTTSNSKRLLGVKATPALVELVQQALTSTTSNSEAGNAEVSTETNRSNLDPSQPLSLSHARQILTDYEQELQQQREQAAASKGKKKNTSKKSQDAPITDGITFIPIRVLRAVPVVLAQQCDDNHNADDAAQSLSQALTNPTTGLVFSNPTKDENSEEAIAFRRRLERLRVKQEQVQYARLTHNVQKNAAPDEINTRTMTYAASIGLNMIIAPLSFGCFMYFFAGGLFEYLGWNHNASATSANPNAVDIRKVIAGVVSGVLMLIIEMVLFVIRTHTLEKAVRSKQSKQSRHIANGGAFGYYTANTKRHYKEQ